MTGASERRGGGTGRRGDEVTVVGKRRDERGRERESNREEMQRKPKNLDCDLCEPLQVTRWNYKNSPSAVF